MKRLTTTYLHGIIAESIRKVLNEGIGFGFSLGYLKQLRSFAEKVRYCDEYLGGRIGNGTSRIVYQLDDEKVLKLAKNDKGIAQNEQEGRPDYYRDSIGIFAEVYYNLSDQDDYTFIVSEYVLPAKEKDLERIIGLDECTYERFVNTAEYNRLGRRKNIWNRMDDEDFQYLLEQDEYGFLYQLNDYIMSYDMPAGDFSVLRNLGIVSRDGQEQLVILDSGLSNEVYNKYYSKN